MSTSQARLGADHSNTHWEDGAGAQPGSPSDEANPFALYNPSSGDGNGDLDDLGLRSDSPPLGSLLFNVARKSLATAQDEQLKRTKDNKHSAGIEEIKATISTDLAEGHSVIFDKNLKLLLEDELQLILATDYFEAGELHIIEVGADEEEQEQEQGKTAKSRSSVHALQDYQMQLMLLEQQNKKRLMMARHEVQPSQFPPSQQSKAPAIQVQQVQRPLEVVSIDHQVSRTVKTPSSNPEQQSVPPQPPFPPRATAPGPVPKIVDTMKGLEGHVFSTKRAYSNMVGTVDVDPHTDAEPKRPRSGASEDLEPPWNGERPDMLLHTQAIHTQAVPFDLIYLVVCSDGHGSHPEPSAFFDEPFVDDSKQRQSYGSYMDRSHLNGSRPVLDLEILTKHENQGANFLIVRTVKCSPASVAMVQAGTSAPFEETLHTKSRPAKELLEQIATCYYHPTHTNEDDNGRMNYPSYKETQKLDLQTQISPLDLFAFHHRQNVKDFASKHENSQTIVDELARYTETRFGIDFAAADDLFANGEVDQDHITKLFKPNEVIISGTYGLPAAFVLLEWPGIDSSGWIELRCWSFQTDGTNFVRKETFISIPPLSGGKTRIRTLPAYPLTFAPASVVDVIRARGIKYWGLRHATHVSYRGHNVSKDQFFPDARFMIDHKVYRKMHEHASAFRFPRPATTHAHDSMPASLSPNKDVSEICFLLMPPDIHGFYLQEKKWIKLFVDHVRPISWNKTAYERLVLPPSTKDLVKALVTVRASQKGIKGGLGMEGKRIDITAGKGNGLIMLLHGGPGTGKTLTAESVAEIAEMPLYRVTCGDIGTNAEGIEKYLNVVLQLGKTWNCVLLLDEADVFLEERSMSDLKRNSLVSVFLRILEYYDGILILTSNRVGMFDEAFKSRIQVALHYENLNRASRKKIWTNFIDMLEEDEEDANFSELRLRIDELASREFNGRQIRNVLTTARQLAAFRGQRLDWDHMTQALSVAADFNDYLKRMQGNTDDQRARDSGVRY